MKNLTYCESWPESWKYSYPYDCLEIYGQRASLGYAYAYRQRVKHTIDFIQTVAKPGAKVLDIAAAQGNFSLRLAELNQVHVENRSSGPHPQPLSQRAFAKRLQRRRGAGKDFKVPLPGRGI
jgi:hypothetical protein